jgi:2-polyprenyl-3-methyl-5-hydroxy-6-metoxy-1,4-benzoquinol methylase
MQNLEELVVSDFLGFSEMIEISCSQLYTGGQSLYVCRDTGLVRAKNVRSSHEIAKAWSDDVFGDTFDEKTYTARIPAVRARQTYVADFADSYIGLEGKMCCDLGAGEGQFLEIISRYYRANVFGIEPSQMNCNQMLEKKLKCFLGTAEEYIDSPTFRPEVFDVVTAMWTLVNSSHPLHLLKTAFESLKNGGYLVVAEGS